MAEDTNIITVADLATALGLPGKSTKAEVLAAIGSLRGGGRPARKLSSKFESKEQYDKLAAQKVRVRVIAPHPIAERGAVYHPPVFDPNGKLKTPGEVFETDKARLLKIAAFVQEVDKSTPTTAELKAKAA